MVVAFAGVARPARTFGVLHPPRLASPITCHNFLQTYATQTSLGPSKTEQPKHKRVTVFNDDGRVHWGQLTTGEKIARTTQQSFNFTLIAGGAAATIAVFTLLYTDVFSQDSSITQYNHAVNVIRTDPRCIELLGPSKEITATGDPTGTSWIRQRPKATFSTDRYGTERMNMSFQIRGPVGKGVAQIYMLRRRDESHFSYGHLALDVAGQSRIYLENGDEQASKKAEPGSFLGIKWR